MDTEAAGCSNMEPVNTLCGRNVRFYLRRLAVITLNIKSRF